MEKNPALEEIVVQWYLNGVSDYSDNQIKEAKNYMNLFILKRNYSKLTDVEKQIVNKWYTDLSISKNDRMVILGGPTSKKWQEWKEKYEAYFDKAQVAAQAAESQQQKKEEVHHSPGSQNQSEAEMNINMNVNFEENNKEEIKMENQNAQAQQNAQEQGQEKGLLEKAWENKGTIIGAAAVGAAATIGVQKLMSNDKSSYGSTMGDVAETVSQFRGMFSAMR
jgi:hypothetical protein